MGLLTALGDFFLKFLPSKWSDFFKGWNSDKPIDKSFPPLKISVVAPSGFGKTTLISTVMQEIDSHIQIQPGWDVEVHPHDPADEQRLLAFDKKLNEAIQARKSRVELQYNPSSEIYYYDFDLKFKIKDEKGTSKICQPFCMADIPGGWIDLSNRTDEKTKNDWSKFEEHLFESRILWIPIDCATLIKPVLSEEKEISVQILDTTDVEKIVNKWVKHRASKNEESCVCYVPIKSESFSDDEIRTNVKQYYEGIINLVEKQGGSKVRQYITKVHTIGCVQLMKWKFFKKDNKPTCETEYHFDGGYSREIRGADKLLKKVYEYACEEIENVPKSIARRIDQEKGSVQKELRNLSSKIQILFYPLIQEFSKLNDIHLEEI